MIKIEVNGEKKEVNKNITLLAIIRELQIEDKVMACALNMEIVKKDNWEKTSIKDGDKIELLNFVGGG